MTEPCNSCGGAVRIQSQTVHTLGGAEVVESRVCPDRDCETNERPRTMGTPTP